MDALQEAVNEHFGQMEHTSKLDDLETLIDLIEQAAKYEKSADPGYIGTADWCDWYWVPIVEKARKMRAR